MIGNGKHSSLLQYGNNYCRKGVYSTGPSIEGITEKLSHFEMLPESINNKNFHLKKQKCIFWTLIKFFAQQEPNNFLSIFKLQQNKLVCLSIKNNFQSTSEKGAYPNCKVDS